MQDLLTVVVLKPWSGHRVGAIVNVPSELAHKLMASGHLRLAGGSTDGADKPMNKEESKHGTVRVRPNHPR